MYDCDVHGQLWNWMVFQENAKTWTTVKREIPVFFQAGFSLGLREISHGIPVRPRLFGEMVSFIGDTMQQPAVVPRFFWKRRLWKTIGVFPKIGVPKMDGENNGKLY